MKNDKFRPDRVKSYFRAEWKVLAAVTVSGLIYNVGLLANPWFDGKLAGCLVDVLGKKAGFSDMLRLALCYVAIIALVQAARYVKRFYVRRFANNINRRMKHIIYHDLLRKSRAELEQEGAGNVMTKAISDVDDCAEGMRKFTTEIFDTGVALVCYAGMLLWYDWKLALISMLFPPVSYFIAEKMKYPVQKAGAAFKEQTGKLNADTMDRVSNAMTYRVFGCEEKRNAAYENTLDSYEKSAVKANIWISALPPLYNVICMAGAIFILWFGSKNVLGQGWCRWDIAVFTTFLSCYSKLSVKSSKAAKLFNSVHKAQVSWKRIRLFMNEAKAETVLPQMQPDSVCAGKLSFAYPSGDTIFSDLSFEAEPGQIIGVTGPVACGKSTLGKTFLCEYPYSGSLRFGGKELAALPDNIRNAVVGYLGHDTELLNDSIKDNVLMGTDDDVMKYLKMVCLDREVMKMESGADTLVGNGGVRLSGGQAQRLALARTLCHRKPLMILDDPFSALDRDTEEKVFEELKKNAGDGIILLISHRLYLFPQLDRIIWMNKGQHVVSNHEELMKTVPLYAELYNAQKGDTADEK